MPVGARATCPIPSRQPFSSPASTIFRKSAVQALTSHRVSVIASIFRQRIDVADGIHHPLCPPPMPEISISPSSRASTSCARVGCALVLMAATADAVHIGGERNIFWERYADFWSGGDDHTARALRDSFASAAATRALAVRRECLTVMQQADWRALVSGYAGTLEKFIANGQLTSAEQHCSQFIDE
jgi:hypothetical protein